MYNDTFSDLLAPASVSQLSEKCYTPSSAESRNLPSLPAGPGVIRRPKVVVPPSLLPYYSSATMSARVVPALLPTTAARPVTTV